MTWAEFKAAVRVLLTVDADRIGTEQFIEQHTRAAVQDLLHFIHYYRKDFVTTLLPTDFVTEQYASRAELTPGIRLTSVDILRRDEEEVTSEGCLALPTGSGYINDETVFPNISAGPITFECWAKIAAADTLHAGRYLVGYSSGLKMFNLRLANATGDEGDCKLRLVMNFPVTQITLNSTASIVPDQWNHYAFVWDSAKGVANLWINGVLDSTAATTESALIPDTQGDFSPRLRIGQLFKGFIDEVKLWNSAKDEQHFSRRFNEGNVEPGMIAYYKFNTGTGLTADERGENGTGGALASAQKTKNEVTGHFADSNTSVLGFQYYWSEDHFPVSPNLSEDYLRHPCVNVGWDKRQLLINNLICVNDGNGRIAIEPNGSRLYVYPLVQSEDDEEKQMLVEITYDTDTVNFSDADRVPFDDPMVHCVSDWVKGELARHVDRDLNAYASFLAKPGAGSRLGGSYFQKRTQLYLRAKELGQLND